MASLQFNIFLVLKYFDTLIFWYNIGISKEQFELYENQVRIWKTLQIELSGFNSSSESAPSLVSDTYTNLAKSLILANARRVILLKTQLILRRVWFLTFHGISHQVWFLRPDQIPRIVWFLKTQPIPPQVRFLTTWIILGRV